MWHREMQAPIQQLIALGPTDGSKCREDRFRHEYVDGGMDLFTLYRVIHDLPPKRKLDVRVIERIWDMDQRLYGHLG
jgi:hypothetical protein